MKVILTDDVKKIGKKGELVNVKTGYFRNFLEPNNLAVVADKENVQKLEEEKAEQKKIDEENREEATKIKEKIEKEAVVIKVRAGEEGKLFGKVTNKDVAEALENKSISVDKKKISFDTDVDSLGEFTAKAKLYTDIVAEIKVIVEAE